MMAFVQRGRFPRLAKVAQYSSSQSTRIEGTIPRDGIGIAVNQYAEVRRVFSPSDVAHFGDVVGDKNPLHESLPAEEVRQSIRKSGLVKLDGLNTQPLVHGMLAASLFSCIFGTIIPGSVYRSQSLAFRNPIFVNDSVVARVDVRKVREAPKAGGVLVFCSTKVVLERDQTLCIEGEANVWLPAASRG
jgi:3-hydroxybutyryl-CoA dehydratase